jgi:AraC-like DNA-binding protein
MGITYGAKVTVQIHPNDQDDRLAFVMAKNGTGQMKIGGQEHGLTAQQGVVFPAGPQVFLSYEEDCETLTLMLSRSKLIEQCGKLLGREIDKSVEFEPRLSLESPTGATWQRLVQYAADELSNPESMTRQMPVMQQQLEQMLISTFLLGQSHNYSAALLQPQSAAIPYYVKRAEAYMEAHFDEPLSLADIAAQAGVSARSLQSGFQSFRNMSPMAFLRSIRLQKAQQALLKADPAVATVTEIALGCGFSHMGEFSALYRRTFDETPRQTLLKTSWR